VPREPFQQPPACWFGFRNSRAKASIWAPMARRRMQDGGLPKVVELEVGKLGELGKMGEKHGRPVDGK